MGMMADKLKTLLAILFFLAALTLPLIGLAVGWIRWDLLTGFLIMVVIFLFFNVLGVATLLWVKNLSWITVSLPYVFSALYGFLPDTIPFSLDDAAVTSLGAIFTFGFSLRKNPDTPKWVFIPLIASGFYALLGGTIPGGFDEAIVDILALVIALIGTRRRAETQLLDEDEKDSTID
jgi:hypothetical protein